MEEVYARKFVHNTDISFREIDMIYKIGLTQKINSSYLKDSVDGLIFYLSYHIDLRSKSLLLVKFKARLLFIIVNGDG